MTAYQAFTGARCACRPGNDRDNCPRCEGTGRVIDFAAIRAMRETEQHAARHAAAGLAQGDETLTTLGTRQAETCDYCGEPMYVLVRGHHHAEDGKDVTGSGKRPPAMLYSVSVDTTGYSGDYNDVLMVAANDREEARRLAEEYALDHKGMGDAPYEVTHSEAYEWAAGPRVLGPLDMED